MSPYLPTESLAASFEMVCYGFTVVAAAISYMLTMRF